MSLTDRPPHSFKLKTIYPFPPLTKNMIRREVFASLSVIGKIKRIIEESAITKEGEQSFFCCPNFISNKQTIDESPYFSRRNNVQFSQHI